MTPSETQRVLQAVPPDCEDARCVNERNTLREELARVREELELAEKELRTKRTQLKKARGERNKAWEASPFAKEAEQVYSKWRALIAPGAKGFGAERAEPVIALLEATRSVEDFYQALEGARAMKAGELDWQPRNPATYFALENIAKSDTNLMRFMAYADEAKLKREEGTRAARHTFIVYNEQVHGFAFGAHVHDRTGVCPACSHPTCTMDARSTEFKCLNGCAPDDILKGLRSWWEELYPDQRSRRIALSNIATGKRLAAQRDAA